LSAFTPTYEYEFNDRKAPSTLIVHPPFPLGAFHAAEIQYVFQTYFPARRVSAPPNFTPPQLALSNQMAAYWVNFIKAGNLHGASPQMVAWQARPNENPVVIARRKPLRI
jgi:para-nitrobenzyl esterase